MSTRDFQLVMRINAADETKYKTLETMFVTFAKEVYATGVLLQGPGAPKPNVKVFSEDMFHGKIEAEVTHDDPTNSEQPDDTPAA